MGKRRATTYHQQQNIQENTNTEEMNVFEIPVSKDRPYIIPGTSIGIKTTEPIGTEQQQFSQLQLLEEIKNQIIQIKGALKNDQINQQDILNKNDALPIQSDQVDKLSHREKLSLLTDLTNVQKHLQENVSQNLLVNHFDGQSPIKTYVQKHPLQQFKEDEEFQKQKDQASIQQGKYSATKPTKSPNTQYNNQYDNIYKKLFVKNIEDAINNRCSQLNQSVDQSINKVAYQQEQNNKPHKHRNITKYDDDTVIPDARTGMPTTPAELECVKNNVCKSVFNEAYRKINFVKMVNLSNSQNNKIDDLYRSTRPHPKFTIVNQPINLISGAQQPEKEFDEEYAKTMNKYTKQSILLIKKQLEQQNKETFERMRKIDKLEEEYQQNRSTKPKKQRVSSEQDKLVKKHLLQILSEKQMLQEKEEEKINVEDNSQKSYHLPQFSNQQKATIQNQEQIYDIPLQNTQQVNINKKQVFEDISNNMINELIDEAIQATVEKQQRQIENDCQASLIDPNV